MRDDDMLRLSLECARLAVRGEDFAPVLAAGAETIMRTDAGTALVTLPAAGGVPNGFMPRVVVSGIPPADDAYISAAVELAPRHPHFNRDRWFDSPTSRVSDLVALDRFWETDVWVRMHGHVNGRYAAGANLGSSGGIAAFLGVQRANCDFSDDDMEVLDLVRGPLVPALAFRNSWDVAMGRVQRAIAERGPSLTRREAQVIALVARGWTNGRIAHTLAVSERTVRKHLENINDKLGTANRASAVNRWRHPDTGAFVPLPCVRD